MMTTAVPIPAPLPAFARRLPVYYGWVMVVVAATAMVATLPGRTQGLGLVTEPLLRDFGLGRVEYARLNLWTTLLGSLACLGFGRLLDRWGARRVLTLVTLLLGAAVMGMAVSRTTAQLAVLLLLTRGLGQSALSSVSISLVGQWFPGGSPRAMAAYSLLLSFGFMAAFPLVGGAVDALGWRTAWGWVGLGVMSVAILGHVLVRNSPESAGVRDGSDAVRKAGWTAAAAFRTPAFWVFGLAGALYGLVASGIGLFNESILVELGFAPVLYHRTLAVTALTGLAGNFLGGWLGQRRSPRLLLTPAMALLGGGLFALPHLHTTGAVYVQAVVMGLSGGLMTVLFFGFWVATYGRAALGTIQGMAQMLTVIASATGPLLLALTHQAAGSYAACFRLLAFVAALVALLGMWVPLPNRMTKGAKSEGNQIPA